MVKFYDNVWLIADKRGWTDNKLLDVLMDWLLEEPSDVQMRALEALESAGEQD